MDCPGFLSEGVKEYGLRVGLFMAWLRAVGSLFFVWKIAGKSDILSQVRELCKMVDGMI